MFTSFTGVGGLKVLVRGNLTDASIYTYVFTHNGVI